MRSNRGYFAVAGLLLLAAAYSTNATTINGIANQLVTGLTAHAVVIGEGTSDLAVAAPSTAGQALISNGSSSDPSFQVLPNSGLQNSSVTINTAGCISGGAAVALGASLSLSTTCATWGGVTNASPGATPTWTLANGDIAWTLSANASPTVTIVAGDKWVHHMAQICQPGAGGPWTVTWPSNVKGGMTVGTTASKCSMQTFESFDGTNLYATGTGVINQ